MIRNNDWPVQSTLIDKLPGYHARLITWADLGEGPRGPRPPLFFLYLQNVLLFCFENRFIPCSFILSPGTLTLLYFAHNAVSCMSWKVKFSLGRGEGGGVGDSAPSFWIFWIRPWRSRISSVNVQFFFNIPVTYFLKCFCATLRKILTSCSREIMGRIRESYSTFNRTFSTYYACTAFN